MDRSSRTSPPSTRRSNRLLHQPREPRVAVIGVPSSLGGLPLGADLGPGELRRRGLLGRLRAAKVDAVQYRDVPVPSRGSEAPTPPEALEPLTQAVASLCGQAFRDHRTPLLIGGDHSISIGSMAASAAHDPAVGILWLDAHPDFNTPETSPSGHVHGMVLAIAAGLGPRPWTSVLSASPTVPPSRIAVVGARHIDPGELRNLRRAEVRVLGAGHIRRQGIETTVEEAVAYLAANGATSLHVSVDLDVLDPGRWPGVSTPAGGGMSGEDLCRAVELAAQLARVIALDIVELTPPRDRGGATAEVAIQVAERALGAASRYQERARAAGAKRLAS